MIISSGTSLLVNLGGKFSLFFSLFSVDFVGLVSLVDFVDFVRFVDFVTPDSFMFVLCFSGILGGKFSLSSMGLFVDFANFLGHSGLLVDSSCAPPPWTWRYKILFLSSQD